MIIKSSIENVYPGIYQKFEFGCFLPQEQEIIKAFSLEWYVTYGGEISLGSTSQYRFFLIKPTKTYKELFNINRELIVLFSNYSTLQPRALDAFDNIIQKLSSMRTEKIAMVLVSNDKNVENEIQCLLRSDVERQVIVPFYYSEFIQKQGEFFLKNRFINYFFSRDLFAFNSALKKEFYFFGRNDLVHDIVSRVRANENSGLFGLRKTGKTSIIFGIERVLQTSNILSIFIDCQSPGLHQNRWGDVLKCIIGEIGKKYFPNDKKRINSLHSKDDYITSNPAICFEEDLHNIIKWTKQKQILIIFDEIEHISPLTSPSKHWIQENDFIYLWQTLRSIYQKNKSILTYMIVGTNPKCIELPTINMIDNPIFNQIPSQYIPAFDVPQTQEMVETLGGIMGMKFDRILFSKLTEDFGGHPFLIRLLCSHIHNICKSQKKDRPIRIDKTLYEQGKNKLLNESETYIEMILTILKEHYNDEFEMLKYLALGDYKTFMDLSNISSEYTRHLLGYQIIDCNQGSYCFKIDAIKQYLIKKNKYHKIVLSDKEKFQEISERRNLLEMELRELIRKTIHSQLGESQAKKIVQDIISEKKDIYNTYSLKDIFDPNKTAIYFDDLRKIICTQWKLFEMIFGRDRETFESSMKTINKYRVDCHAKTITDEEMSSFRISISKIEDFISRFN